MQLRELSLFVPKIEPGTILKALETAIPASAIEQALKDTKASEGRKRALPSHLVELLRSVSKGMLLMWDRGLHSYVMVMETLSQGADYLGRMPKNVKFPTDIPFF